MSLNFDAQDGFITPINKSIIKEIVIICSLIMIFFASSMVFLRYEDVVFDEIGDANWAVSVMTQQIQFNPSEIVVMHLFDKYLPVNMEPHLFALTGLIVLPFFSIFGGSYFLYKLISVIFSSLGIAAAYFVLKHLFNKKIAVLTMILFVTSPVYVNFSRQGFLAIEPIINSFIFAGILFYLLFRAKKNTLYLCYSAFFMGAGLSIKLSVVSRYIGLFIAGLIVYPKSILSFYKAPNIKHTIYAILFFAVGSSFFLYYNIVSKGGSFILVKYAYTKATTTIGIGVNKMTFSDNAIQRMRQIVLTIKDGIPGSSENETSNKILLFCFSLALVFNLLLCSFNKKLFFERKKVIFAHIFFLVVFATILFSPKSFQYYHLGIMYPFPQFTVALAIFNISQLPGIYALGKRVKIFTYLIVCLITLIVIIAKISLMFDFYDYKKRASVHYAWINEGRSKLITYLTNKHISPVLYLDENIAQRIFILTNGKFGGNMAVLEPDKKAFNFLVKDKKVYLVYQCLGTPFYSPDVDDRFLSVKKLIYNEGGSVTLFDTIKSNKGNPLYEIYSIN